ncbi:MAG: ABC transporter ATP-binding protein/permease [Cryomorphaceae bacterium]|jgi:ABC-type multidrug transport system fused ATPase/permease subunit|nr:ABC transporter ATP-binding protein/permease [Cryomorphaceae bacterium]
MAEKTPTSSKSVSGKAFDWAVLRRVLRFAQPYRTLLLSAGILSVALGAVTTVRPYLVQLAVDFAVEDGNLSMLRWSIAALMLTLVLEGIGQWFFVLATNELGQKVIRDVRVKLFGQLLHYRAAFFDRTPVGQLVTRTVSDVETMADIFAEGLLVIFGDLFKIAVMVVAMFLLFDPGMVAVSLSVVPILYVATRWFQKSIKGAFTDVRNQVAALNSFVQERITGMAVVQLFGREGEEARRFDAINQRHRDANIKSIWYFSLFFPIIDMLSALSIGLAIWYGGWRSLVAPGSVSIGDLTALIMFINMLYRPLRQLADRFNTLQMGMVASDRVLKLVEQTDQLERPGTHQAPHVRGLVEFDDLYFGYLEDQLVLHGVTLRAEPGEMLALVGSTGSGKSTLIGLLAGMYHPSRGDVRVDGVPVRAWDFNALRSRMALVQQDVFLFSDTVRNNVTLYRPMPDERIWAAAAEMGIKDFLEGLPGGLDYDVKERGGMLSTGQRQLLAFLRAYLANPDVLILDEATSSVDSQSEAWIQKATERITKGRTSVVVAHRLATVLHADRIAVLEHGKVVEQGTHRELLDRAGVYANLYAKQFFGSEAR